MKFVQIPTKICQWHLGKGKFSQDNNIFMTFRPFLCSFKDILTNLNASNPIFNEFLIERYLTLEACCLYTSRQTIRQLLQAFSDR